jgi:hypothetical protein
MVNLKNKKNKKYQLTCFMSLKMYYFKIKEHH